MPINEKIDLLARLFAYWGNPEGDTSGDERLKELAKHWSDAARAYRENEDDFEGFEAERIAAYQSLFRFVLSENYK